MIEYDLILMSLVIFLPSVFALALMFFPRGSDEYMRWWSLLGTAVTLVLSIWLLIDFQFVMDFRHSARPEPAIEKPDKPDSTLLSERAKEAARRRGTTEPPESRDLVARYPWISHFNIDYFLGVDGISLPLILLTAALSFLAMLASWNIEKYVRGYCVLFLILETGMIGTFLALDFFLFYIFWEVMLLPMYFLIGVWGGPRREYAAIKFFLYTLLGSVFILIALLAFYFTNVRDFVDQTLVEKAEKRGREQAQKPEEAVVNTFDLMVLHDVGKAASRVIKHDWVNEIAKAHERLKKAEEPDGDVKEKAAALKRRADLEELVTNRGLIEARKIRNDAEARGTGEAITRARDRLAIVEKRLDQTFFSQTFQYIMFLLLFVGFAIKVPLFPFHTWLPDAHVEAPTPISMILAGVLLKMGGYGILRIAYPICPWAAEALAWYLALFGIINIVYGAFAAMAQTDFKKLVAYSSISHMGYVILGIAVWASADKRQYWEWGMNGAMFQMIAHGITSAGMFFLVGVIYDRAHHRNLDNFRGLNEPMPLYSGISAIIFFAALGLPGLCGFVGEFFVVLSTWNFTTPEMPHIGKVFAILAAGTVVVTAAYILWTVQRVFLGTNSAYKDYPDINLRELLCIIPLVILSIVLGIVPYLLLSWMEPHVTGLVKALAHL